MELKNSIGQRIRELRLSLGLTQDEITRDPAFGIKRGTLAAYEQNSREPSLETVVRMASFFGISTDYLLGASDHKTAELAAAGAAAPLSDGALSFLNNCDADLLDMVDAVLAAEKATDFFEDLRAYVIGSNTSPEDLARDLVDLDPMAARLNRSPSKSLLAARAEERVVYLKHILDRDLAGLCDELALKAAEQLAEDYTAGADQDNSYEKKGE